MEQRTPTGGEKIIQCLEREGVEYVFGLSGGAALPIFDALVDSKIQLVLVRHEQGATHMADGYARSTGRPGVVLVTSGPGATNTVTGLLTALADSSPIIVLCGQTICDFGGSIAAAVIDNDDLQVRGQGPTHFQCLQRRAFDVVFFVVAREEDRQRQLFWHRGHRTIKMIVD